MIKLDCPKLVKSSVILSIFFLVFFPNAALALSSDNINFQGKIVRNDTGYEGLNVTTGSPACVVAGNGNDTCDFEVKYYSAASGGTLLLTEDYQNTEIGQYNGAFNLSLGSDGTPTAGSYATFDAMIRGVTDLYVQLGFSPAGNATYSETFSRMPIQASAYALKAKYASGANTAFQFDSAANSSGYTTPVAGMVYYDTTDAALKVYNGSTWGGLGSGTGSLFTDGGIFTYLTSLTDHFVLGSSSYTAIGADSYTTYLSGLSTRPSLSFDMTAERLTISGSQAQSGLTVYSNYNTSGGWPVATFKAEDSNFDNVVMQITQDGIGNILSLQKGSTEAFAFENPLTFYIHPRTDNPTVTANRLYNVNGTLYWNGSAVGGGSSSLWTDGGTFTYLTSTTDDVVIGGDTLGAAAFFFDVSTGNFGIGTSTPGAKLDIAGSNSTIANTTGDITITSDEAVVIKANNTAGDNLMEWQNSTGTVLGLINQSGYASFGTSTNNAGAMLTLGASTGTVAQINLATGLDVAAPNTGDMWWNGTSLYFFDGSTSVDLLTAGGGGSNVLSNYGMVSNGTYIGVTHDTNSYDVVASGWICVGGSNNAACSGGQWKNVQETDFTITHSLSNQWQDADTDGIIRSIIKLTDVELAPGVVTGNGADGSLVISVNTNINTVNSTVGRTCTDGGDAVNYSVASLASNGLQATLSTTPSTGCLNANDEILLINLQGTSSAYPNVGNYEMLRISNVSGTTVTFQTAKTKYYGNATTDDTNIGTGATNQKVMLQRIPNYTNVTVNSGYSFYPSAWDGLKGGVMAFRANGTVSVAGSISAGASGYRNYSDCGSAVPGESYDGGYTGLNGEGSYGNGRGDGSSTAAGAGYNRGGGGASGPDTSGQTDDGTGGGGGGGYGGGGGGGGSGADGGTGGYGGAGGGTGQPAGGGGGSGGTGTNGGTNGGAGGTSAGAGGAGGSGTLSGAGGGGATNVNMGSGGGGGGGMYGDVNLSKIYFGSAGGNGTIKSGYECTGAGGSGGGIVLISSSTVTVSGSINSTGGTGSSGTYHGGGGGGAGGSVKIYANNATLGAGLVSASGGAGGNRTTQAGGGGAGGVGRIAVYYATTITGSTSPTYTGTSVGYYNYGVYNSPIISTPNAQSYDNLRWDASLNTYGKISVQTRSGNTPDPTSAANDGSLDTTFTQTGTGFNEDISSIVLQSDGKIIVGGYFTAYNGTPVQRLVRLNSDGTLDTTFAQTGTGLNDDVYTVALQSDGKILVGGWFTTYNGVDAPWLTRLNSDGTLDTTFTQTGWGLNGSVSVIVIQRGGKILIGGDFDQYNGTPTPGGLARLNSDGTLDTTFVQTGTGLSGGSVYAITMLSDDRILIGGTFTSYNGTSRSRVARLNSDGTLDTTFAQTGTGLSSSVYTTAIQSDGKILVGGSFTSYNGTSMPRFARLNADGTLDTSFVQAGSGLSGSVYTTAIQSDGKILVGGVFVSYAGTSTPELARLNSNGTLDSTFSQTGTGIDGYLNIIVIQEDKKILIGGGFNSYNSISRSKTIRLSNDGAWEAWKPYTSGTNYTTLQSADTHTDFSSTNATVAEGDITRNVDYFEDEDEPLGTNITKVTSSTNGGYMESSISAANLSNYDYVTLWVRASQAGNVLRIGMGESTGADQYEDITIDVANVWQKVYWDLSDITATSRDAITKIRLTNFSGVSNTIYLDNVRAEKLLSTSTGSAVASTPNQYFQYRVIFTTTNLSYQPQLESISLAYNSGYRIVMYDSNNVRLYNYSGGNQYMRLEVVASTGGSGSGGGGFVNGLAVSHVADGEDAIAFQFNTSTSFTNPTSKLLSVMNNSVEKMYLDANGNLYVAGTITSGKGLGAALVNNSGGIVAERSLVTVDSSTNGAFTTTTVAGLQGALGVVQGVEVNGDVDKDGVCDNGDACLVAFEGVVDVKLDNAASSSKGDYVYSSTVAGQGHSASGTTQTNGMLGVVTSTATSGSGYVKMVFDAQNKVTADMYLNVSYDENVYRDIYNQLANDYTAMSDAERRGYLESNQSQTVMFDNFVDSLKIDSTNSTIGVDADAKKAGLWGGVTIDNSMLDIAGNRYLGSATATLLTSKYYDRTQSGLQDQDSTPETLVNIGVDPNWYKGVSLQTTSNLTTSYNGSLIGVSGVYGVGSEHGYIDLTVTGTTTTGITANIVSSDGNCTATGANLAFNSSYAFVPGSCSGSSITIKPVRSDYKNGDKFRIASWYVEPTTTDDRGVKREFPERSVIIASRDLWNGYLIIIDADTQRVWMRFAQTGTEVFGSIGNIALDNYNTMSSIAMVNGELSVGTNGNLATGLYSLQFNNDQIYKYSTSGKSISNKSLADRNIANTYSIVNANQALVNNAVNDVSSATVPNQPTQNMTVSGWGYVQGTGVSWVAETVNLPYKFDQTPIINVSAAGFKDTTSPSNIDQCSQYANPHANNTNNSSSSFTVNMSNDDGTVVASSRYLCYTWTATGQVSPKQFVAVATGATGVDGGVTVVNKTAGSSVNLNIGSQYADALYSTKIALTNKGDLYFDEVASTALNQQIHVYYGIAGITSSEASLSQYRNGIYRQTGVASAGWSVNGISWLGSGSSISTLKSLDVTQGTSTTDGKSNTIYIGTDLGVTVLQEKQSGGATFGDGMDEKNGSVKYYTKDYISEQMVGDIRGMWPLNYDNTSADNEDVSIKANALTAVNIDSNDAVSGVRGKAVDFNGTDEYLYCTDATCGGVTKTDITGNVTVSAWINPANVVGTKAILAKGDGGIAPYSNYRFYISGQNLSFNTYNGTNYTVTATGAIPTANTWYNVVGTYDGSVMRVYVNGVETSSLTGVPAAAFVDNTERFTVGSLIGSGVPASYFAGIIDEPMVTGTVLSAAQIKSQYEDGLRALKGSHTSADTYNQLSGTSNDVRDILVTPDSKYMYVGTEGGGISKIDLTSSTRLNAYTTATDPSTSTNSIETLSGRYYPVFAGDIGSSGSLMGIDSNGNNSSGTYYSKVTTFAESTNRAFLWMTASIDPTYTSSYITVSASNDNGANYVTGTLIQTNTSGLLPEYEYSFVFPTSDKNYKVKFELARGSSNKTAIYITKWGLSQMKMDSATVNGLFTNSNDVIANGSYLELIHGQNTYDLVANGWVFDTTLNKWIEISNTDNGITQNLSNQWQDANVNGIIRSIVKLTDVELAPGVNTGTGADGAITVSSNISINGTSLTAGRTCVDGGDAVNYSVTALTSTSATLESAPSTGCLNIGDEFLLINLRGTYTAMDNVGNYETLRISNVAGNVVNFTTAKSKYYGDNTTDDTNIGIGTGNQAVMLQRVPNYTNVTVNPSMTFYPDNWVVPSGTVNNGAGEGGVIFFRATGAVSVSGNISATNTGYTGGAGVTTVNAGTTMGGNGGEGYCGAGGASGVGGAGGNGATGGGAASAGNGGNGYCGGGGSIYSAGTNGTGSATRGGSGGAGAAHYPGGAGGYGTFGNGGINGGTSISGNGNTGAGGGGGGTYGDSSLSKLYFGGSGGAGGAWTNGATTSGSGGRGGGIVYVASNALTVAGTLASNGGSGTASSCSGTMYAGGGSGGAGGSIYLKTNTVALGSSLVQANGGNGAYGCGNGAVAYPGYIAGQGRIVVAYTASYTGSTANATVTSYTSVGYYNYGIYNSGVISTTNAQSYDNLKWDAALNTYGKISVQTRSGATNNPADGTWEGWKPSVSGTNTTTLQSADTHTDWAGTNATVAEGDVTRSAIYGFEDEMEPLGTNITKVTSSTNGGYMESTIAATNLTNYDYVTLWLRASQAGNTIRIGMGENTGADQYEDITIDTANVWQKVYWDISDIAVGSKDAITKLRLTNFSTSSNVVYLDSVDAEKLLSTSTGSPVASTANNYFQYRVIFTTTNLSYQPQLENITFTYSSGFKIQITDANTVRLYNNSGKAQKLKLDVILGSAAIDLRASEYSVNIAPNAAQIDGGNYTNSIWINKMGTGGNLLKLQTNSVDMMVVSSEGDMTLAGDVAIGGGSLTLGTSGDQGTVRYNTSTNQIEFSNDGIAWMPLGESTRKVTLSAEYAGAVLSGDGSDNVGSMTSDNTGSSSNSMNYYEWNSSALSLNDYDVRVRFTLPSDFNGWGSTGGVKLNYATESTSNTNNKVDMYIYEEGSVTVDGTFAAGVSSSAGVWTNSTVAGTDLNECATAGDTCVFIMRMSSLGDNYVRIGDIAITYNRSL